MDGKNCIDRDNLHRSATFLHKKRRRTFRDYNRVGESLRDSPIHGETRSKEYGDLLPPRTLEVLCVHR